jgi:hypothetical protein
MRRSRAPREETVLTGQASAPAVEEPVAVALKEVGAANPARREQEKRRAERNRRQHAGTRREKRCARPRMGGAEKREAHG